MPAVGVPVTVAESAVGLLLVAVWLPQVEDLPRVCVTSCTLSSKAASWERAVSWFVRVVSVVVRAVTGCAVDRHQFGDRSRDVDPRIQPGTGGDLSHGLNTWKMWAAEA